MMGTATRAARWHAKMSLTRHRPGDASRRTVSPLVTVSRRLRAMRRTAAFSWEYVKAVVHSDVPVRRSSSAQMKAGLEPNACCLAHTGRYYWSTTGCSGPCASSDVLQKRLCIYTPGSQGSLLAEYVTCTLTPLVAWGLDASSNTSTHIKSVIETTGIFLIS
jgi:hypothetical protein